MDTSNIKQEWHSLIKDKLLAVENNDELQIQIQQPKAAKDHKPNTVNFYFDRIRYRKEQPKAAPQGEKNIKKYPASNKSIGEANDKTGKMTAVPKQQEKSKKISIKVEQQSSKKNIQIYKQSLFGSHSSPNIPQIPPKSSAEKSKMQQIVPSPQKLAYEKQKNFQLQMKIIDDMNVPRWKIEQSNRKQRNKQKYPNSNTYSYLQDLSTKSKSNPSQFNARGWQLSEKNQHEQQTKKKEKEQQEQEQQQKIKSEKKKREREKQTEMQDFLQGLMGMPSKKVKGDNVAVQTPQNNDNNNSTLLKPEIIQQINAEDQDQIQQIEENQENAQRNGFTKGRQNRIGLRDIVKNYQTIAPGFIRSILSHNYGQSQDHLENKKIPQIFQDQHIYKKTFHYLIMNECIADVSQRLKAVKKASYDPISITINSVLPNNEGLVQVYMKEKGKEGVFQLKNISLSKYRLGIVISQSQYSKQIYGVPSKINDRFAFLVLLVTPQTKQDLDAEVRSLAIINSVQLQYILKSRKSRSAYFYDLDKLTTHVREYLAVSNINYSDISPTVLDPRILQKETASFVENKQVLNDILQHLHNIFNQTQWQSIRQMVLREKGFVLLQGPPGTGKTSTLMGLLSAQYEYLKKTGDNRKIMICAPSNAAVDHIVKRIRREGLFNGNGDIFHPNIIRVGIVQTLDPDIRAVSLDELCQKQVLESNEEFTRQSKMTTPQIKQAIISLQKQIRKLRAKKQDKQQLSRKQADLIRYEAMMFCFRKEKVVLYRRSYRNIECQLLDKAEIILTTLSSTGNERLDRIRGDIACLIVDEAAQATEPNLLIALQTGVDKVILIGDPYQLPATCMSGDANVTLFNRSLFERFLDANIKPYFLNIQYRMAPLIRQFPSSRFYQNRLIDSEQVKDRIMPEFLSLFDKRNVCFLDIKYGQQRKMGQSCQNIEQARAISILISLLFDKSVTLGVITPYQAQRRAILKECRAQMKDRSEEDRQLIESSVMINTVDSFQGQQKDIIIVSTVRANNRNEVGFLVDQRRINVTLTRSKYLLIVVGHGNTLGSNEVWNQFLENVEDQRCYYQIIDNHLLTKNISQTFESNNQKAIHRKRHTQLSSDIRKIQRSQIESKDFKIKKKKSDKKGIEDTHHPINGNEHGENSKNEFTKKRSEPYVASTKYALDIKQSEMIVEQKKRREQQAKKQEQMHIRLRKLQEQRGGTDEFYRQLFS